MSKCDNCLNSRTIISENGRHSICNLPDKQAIECLMGKKDKQIKRPTSSKEN